MRSAGRQLRVAQHRPRAVARGPTSQYGRCMIGWLPALLACASVDDDTGTATDSSTSDSGSEDVFEATVDGDEVCGFGIADHWARGSAATMEIGATCEGGTDIVIRPEATPAPGETEGCAEFFLVAGGSENGCSPNTEAVVEAAVSGEVLMLGSEDAGYRVSGECVCRYSYPEVSETEYLLEATFDLQFTLE